MLNKEIESLIIERFKIYKLAPWEVRMGLGILEGLSNKEIADRLGIKEKTIKTNIFKVYKKIKVKSRSHFIVTIYTQVIASYYLPNRQVIESYYLPLSKHD